METETWRVWDRDDSVEDRTFERARGELPEMECTKQLVNLVKTVYEPGMSVLDVGCAAGHYFHGLRRLDPQVAYCGIDATLSYIEFAKLHFADFPNARFERQDVYSLPEQFEKAFDIVYCCNVVLHLPTLAVPLHSLLSAARRHCFVRTLISDRSHLSKYLYSDDYDEGGLPTNFVHQNTYSYDFIEQTIKEHGNYKIEFIDDVYDSLAINKEHLDYRSKQSAVTRVQNDLQIAGSKVFDWKWIKITL